MPRLALVLAFSTLVVAPVAAQEPVRVGVLTGRRKEPVCVVSRSWSLCLDLFEQPRSSMAWSTCAQTDASNH